MRVLFIAFGSGPNGPYTIPRGAAVPYDRELHGLMLMKFFYWKDGGNGEPLLVCASAFEHKVLLPSARELVHDCPTCFPEAAGSAQLRKDVLPVICSWESTYFNITTPRELRAVIAEALGLAVDLSLS